MVDPGPLKALSDTEYADEEEDYESSPPRGSSLTNWVLVIVGLFLLVAGLR